jgi:membrane protein DedA with SNARE-associated domain
MGFLDAIADWARDVVEAGGYPGVAFMIFLENVFPPIPSELVLPLSGFLACRGDFAGPPVVAMPLTVVAATIGSLAGAYALYGFGVLLGEDRVRAFIVRYGRYLLLTEGDLDRAKAWFAEYGDETVLVGRVIPGIRSLVSIPAGIERMALPRFTLYTVAGSGVWNIALISAGCALGDQWERAERYIDIITYVVIAVLAALVLWFVVRRLRARRSEGQ